MSDINNTDENAQEQRALVPLYRPLGDPDGPITESNIGYIMEYNGPVFGSRVLDRPASPTFGDFFSQSFSFRPEQKVGIDFRVDDKNTGNLYFSAEEDRDADFKFSAQKDRAADVVFGAEHGNDCTVQAGDFVLVNGESLKQLINV